MHSLIVQHMLFPPVPLIIRVIDYQTPGQASL